MKGSTPKRSLGRIEAAVKRRRGLLLRALQPKHAMHRKWLPN